MSELVRDVFLKGNTIYLRALQESDITGNYYYWLNDQDVVKYNSHGRFPQTIEKLREYVKNVSSSNDTLVLAIIDISSSQHIGNISLQRIHWIDRNAEIAFLLGEKSFHGRKIMTEAGLILLNHGFRTLNLHRIYCGTSSENLPMQKLAVRLGMLQEGIRKEAIYKNGAYLDMYEYGILKEDFLAK
ncbi:GNAT family N-acetyltransferase [Leptospira vanthielii]|uniref:N-acetyltransferase n=1 Tax=Leptospira vanthielii TaxID=293085 RepID=A0ABY2NT20_9LEPT|nr:GNAT family N-acetyltransferase [Leptospira vanthielii]TGM60687.1 N-acetyltransferase [Leptospira vanthielii]